MSETREKQDHDEKEESRTVPPAPVLLPAEPPKNPDGLATPEPQAAEGRKCESRGGQVFKGGAMVGQFYAQVDGDAESDLRNAREFAAYLNGTSPLHAETSRLAAQVEELKGRVKDIAYALDVGLTEPGSGAGELAVDALYKVIGEVRSPAPRPPQQRAESGRRKRKKRQMAATYRTMGWSDITQTTAMRDEIYRLQSELAAAEKGKVQS